MDNTPLRNLHSISNDPMYLYLDQNVWIGLGKVYYGKENDRDLSRILIKVKNLIDSKKLIIPINFTNVLEAKKVKNKERRERLARFMILLSKGYSFIPYVYVNTLEMINLMQEKLNQPLINIRKNAIGIGFFYLCSDGKLPLQYRKCLDSLNPSNAQRFFIEKEIKEKFANPNYILNYIISNDDQGFSIADMTAEKLKVIREEEFKRLRDKDFRNRFRLARSLLDVAAPKLSKICYEYGISPRELYPENPSRKQLMDFFKKLPSLYTSICLNNELMKNKDYPIKSNDLHDINSFSFAIPYCDFVVGEKHFISVAKQKKLDKLYNTILISKGNFKDIEPFLDRI